MLKVSERPVASTEESTEVAPLMPQNQGSSFSERSAERRRPRGKAMPIRRPIGNSEATAAVMRIGVLQARLLPPEAGGLTPQMEAMLRASGQEVPKSKRVLELNPSHPVTEKLKTLHASDPDSAGFHQFLELVHGQALLAEGSPLPDPSRFAKLVSDLLSHDG